MTAPTVYFRSTYGLDLDEIQTIKETLYHVTVTGETDKTITVNATVISGDGGEFVEGKRVYKKSIVEVFQ